MIELDKIHKGMDVLTSDGHRIGAVREVLGHVLFLDTGRCPDPKVSVSMMWIADISQAVELAKTREQVEHEWRARGYNEAP
ncbi:DUF2171 domain-containing protein (plasmid) [Microvirga terrae]|uniref:DUF2171 domain-containing protein n=1 Tax=Microvirga terrae TaxID=2740529 RepID=A0ABY5RZ55_9HYPH|nr:DUF2171 domain-containing protein [Microvirga terrae]UVF22525.1 DUF2171 domain-containing protein [Microvirga terrae]